MFILTPLCVVNGQDTSLESLLDKAGHFSGKEKINEQIELADSLNTKSRYAESIEVLRSVFSNSELKGYDSLYCKAMFLKGLSYFFLSEFDSAIKNLNQSAEICNKADYIQKYGRSLQRLGNCYNQLGSFDTSMYFLDSARVIFKQINDREALASVYNSIALVYGDTDRPSKALEYHLKTLSYFDSVDNKRNLSVVQNNIGLLYYDKGETSKALEYYNKSIINSIATGNDQQLAKTYTNLGNLQSKIGKVDSALINYSKSLDISRRTGSKYSLANIHYNLGQLYADNGSVDSAEFHISKSKDLCEELNIYEGLFFCNLGLGDVSKLKGEDEQAIEYYLAAYELSSRFGIENFKKQAASYLHQAYQSSGDFENALKYFEEFHLIEDSLASVQKESEFKELQLKYETKLKEEENKRLKESNIRSKEMLSQQNTYLLILFLILLIMVALIFVLLSLNTKYKEANQALDEQRRNLDLNNAQLEKVNSELKEVISIKDKLMSVISHDLRSPMASLQGLIALLQSDSLSQNEFTQIIRKIETNLLNFSKFSDNILQWVKGQSHGININKEKVSLCELIDDAIKLHARQIELKEVVSKTDCAEGNDLVLADKQSISIVLRNLISNAIKFSPIGGVITIGVKSTEKGVLCSVGDSGMGMDQDLIERIQNRKAVMPSAGTSNEKGLGLGLSLCIEFLHHNGSELKIESKGGSGSVFSFVLPPVEVETNA